MYPSETADWNEIIQEYREAVCALESKINAVVEDFEKKYAKERLDYIFNDGKVPDRHIRRVRLQRLIKQAETDKRMHAWVPDSYVTGKSDEDITYTMPADATIVSEPPPSLTGRKLIDFWSKNQRHTIADQQNLQQRKRNKDPPPKATSGPNGQQVVYVDISSKRVGDGRRPGNSGAAGSGMPAVG